MAPATSKVAKVVKRSSVAAILVFLISTAAQRFYSNSKRMWLIKRFLGFVLTTKVLPFPVPQVVSGTGSSAKVSKVLRDMGCSKPLLVTDENIVKFGLVKPCIEDLKASGLQYEIFDKVVPNPPSQLVEEGHEIYKKGCDSIIAFGGGSPMDTAKIIGAKVANPKDVEAYQGFLKVNMMGLRPLPPLIAVPTTAGTGSETTVAAVISIAEKNKKIAIADLGLVPSVAVLDPTILESLPKPVTAATGMDALTHAIESYLSAWSTPFTREKSLAATGGIFRHLFTTYQKGTDFAAREHMLKAAFDAGLAFTRANVGYVHAIAHQFGGMFHTPHGDANAMLLPHVLGYYLEDETSSTSTLHCTQLYCELALAAGLCANMPGNPDDKRALARKFVEQITDMNRQMMIPTCVKSMKASDVGHVAVRALKEAHGENYDVSNVVEFALDLGYPVPKYMTLLQCESIIAKVLPAEELKVWQSNA